MIWLADKEKLTKNYIKKTLKFDAAKNELLAEVKKNKIDETIISHPNYFLQPEVKKDGTYHEYKLEKTNKDQRGGSYTYRKYTYHTTKPNSLSILLQRERYFSFLMMLGNEEYQLEILRELHEKLNREKFVYLLERYWEDYYYFSTKIQPNITLQTEQEYDIKTLQQLAEMNRKANVKSNVYEILSNLSTAQNNTKILTLSNKISNFL